MTPADAGRAMGHDDPARRVLRQVQGMAPLPRTVAKLLNLPAAETSPQAVADLVSQDPRLAVQVVRLVNQECFALRTTVSSLRQAIPLLGLRAVKSLALLTSVSRIFDRPGLSFDAVGFWRHALVVAQASGKVADHLALPCAEEAELAGLVHDLGLGFLLQRWPRDVAWAMGQGTEGSRATLDAEVEAFGQAHPAVGAEMASSWGLPPVVGDAVRHHHTPEAALPAGLGPEARQVIGVVQLADGFARRAGQWFSDFDRLGSTVPLPAFGGRVFTVAEVDALVGDLVLVIAQLDVLFGERSGKPVTA